MHRLLLGFGVLALLLLACPRDGAAQTITVRGKFQYAVKFVCGPDGGPGTGGPAFGHYSTHVNIHNPNGAITFAKKVAIGFPGNVAGRVSGFVAETLGEDQAETVNCGKIQTIAGTGGGFLEGFLVIVTPKELDVTTVYTGEVTVGSGVTTMHVNATPPRKLTLAVTAPAPD